MTTGMAPIKTVERIGVAGNCPECGAEALSRYPVLAEGGWFDVVKCGHCLASIERIPGSRFGSVVRDYPLPAGRSRVGEAK